ncbi:phage tail spike protein [Helcococcus ovis]|uniref:phage tail spike protein n=1 Tax=Helcococcus TaxID=31983 RepID=UPI0038B6ED17
MIFIYDRNENQIDIVDVNPKFTREFGKFNTLEFESVKEFGKGYRVVYLQKGKIYEFIIKDTEYERENGYIHSYFCQDSIIELKGTHISDKRPKGSYKVALNSIFENTRWELEFGSYSETYNQSNSFFRINVIEAFEKIVKDYDIEWETKFEAAGENITKRIVVIKKIGNVANSRLEFGKNIKKFTRKVGAEPIITGLYGYGKGEETENGGYGRRLSFESINNGKEYVENVKALNTYGIGKNGHKNHYFDTVIFENIEDKQELLRATKKELEIRSKPKIEYTVDAANLHIDCDFGDEVPIIDDHINFRGYKRIIKVVYLNGIEFTFGDITSKFTDSIKNEIAESEQKIKEEMTSAMDSIIKNTSIAFFNQDSYTYDLKLGNKFNFPAGLYSFNKPIEENPTKATYVGSGQVLISNEKGTDNEWVWKSAITGDGIHGQSLISNSITANKLASDVGQSLDLSSNKSIISSVKGQVTEYVTANKAILKGDPGINGKDGVSTYVHIAYARNADGSLDFSLKPGEREYIGILVDNNSEQSKDYQKYIWSRLRGERGPRGLQGLQGENGKDGIKGADGTSSYTHIAYANSEDGRQDFSISDSRGKSYIGMYVDDMKKDSENPYKYKWSLIKGADGTKGIQGAPGKNGKTPYLHIAYANSEDGRRGFSISDSAGKSYIGQYTDFNEYDSFYPDRYKWTKIKGEDGKDADYTQFRQQYSSELKQLQNSIELKVSRDIYDRNNTRIDSKFTSFKLSSTQIEAIAKEFIIKGFLKADEGRLGNWYISKNYIMPRDESVGIGTAANSEHQAVFWAGYKRIANENIYNFVVRKNGKLTAREAEIQGRIKSGSIIEVGEYGKIQATTNGLQINVPRSLASKGGIGLQIVGRKIEQKSGMFIPQGLYIYKDDDFSSGSLPQDSNDFLMSIRGYADIKGIGYIKFNRGKHGGEDYASIGFWESKNVALGFGGDNNDIYYEYNNTTYSLWKVVKNQSSDRKLKENIIDTPHNAIDIISKLRFREYDWKKGKFYAKHTIIGLIAQEVEEVDESFVYEDGDILKLDTLRLASLALKGVKELDEENKKLKEEISEIKKMIEEIKNEKHNNN